MPTRTERTSSSPRSDRGGSRRPPRRTKRQRPKFERILLALVILFAGAYCVKAAVVKLTKPYIISYGEKRDVRDIKSQIADATAENVQLKGELIGMGTPQGKEAEARRIGWVKTGEVAVVVQQPGESKIQIERTEAMKETFLQSAGKRLVSLFVRADAQK